MPKIKELSKIKFYVREQNIEEKFKGQVELKLIKFPKELGEEHPFSFLECEKVCEKHGIVRAIIDKYIDFIISPSFYIKSKNKKAEIIINDLIENVGFDGILRNWIHEGLSKGNGFLELGIDKNNIQFKVINSNNMYIKRNEFGEIIKFNQYNGEVNRFDPKKIIPFEPDEIAHLKINSIGDNAYGFGLISSAFKILDNIARLEKDSHLLTSRKANSPIHAKIGTPEEPATSADVFEFGSKLEYLNNMHEWATDHRVEFKVIDFGNLSDKFNNLLQYDMTALLYAFQIPAVLMGSAYQNEGIAKVQLDAFERRIQSLQANIERIIEEQIFKPILKLNGLDEHVEIFWGQPSEGRVNERINQLSLIMQNPYISKQLRQFIELDIANTLSYKDAENILTKPEKPSEIEREEEENDLTQPEIPGEKENFHIHEELDIETKLSEWINFDYIQYKEEINKFIESDEFKNLKAENRAEILLGKLNQKQINRLKNILKDSFEKNKSLNEISKEIEKLKLRDRYNIDEDGKKNLIMSKEDRPISIARTETTRVSAEGVLNNYKNKGIENVRFLASISSRTCPICLDLNGKIYKLNESREVIPVHPLCRCSWVAIQE